MPTMCVDEVFVDCPASALAAMTEQAKGWLSSRAH